MRKPGHPCARPGCPVLIEHGRFCPTHTQPRQPAPGAALYRSGRWKAAALAYLAKHPWCADPFGLHFGRPTPATTVMHKRAHRGDPTLFWDHSNWAPGCSICNGHQAVTREGGFGNPIPRLG